MIIVGVSGFLGSRLATAFAGRTAVIGVARRAGGAADKVIDLRSESSLAELVKMAVGETVLYCANVGGRAVAERDPVSARLVNTVAPARLAEVAGYIIFLSTDYVFSAGSSLGPLDVPDGRGQYAETKRAGEQAVLQSPADALVVRVSGLFDSSGTKDQLFGDLEQVGGADDIVSTPTYVPDLAQELANLIDTRATGVRHLVGPQALSRYEFLQLASLGWGFDVRPIASAADAVERRLVSDSPTIRSPGAVFSELWRKRRVHISTLSRRPDPGPDPVCVLDCVGTLLGERRTRHDEDFWDRQRHLERSSSSTMSPALVEATGNAYTLNPDAWRDLRNVPGGIRLVVANNGPWATFQLWQERFSLHDLVDLTVNSERDSLTKPKQRFFEHIEHHFRVGPSTCYLADDNPTIVEAARTRGWVAAVAVQRRGAVVDEYRASWLSGVLAHVPDHERIP